MRKLLILTSALFLVFFAYNLLQPSFNGSYEVSAQSCPGTGSCSGPTYCNGPCDVLWYEPCNCSCSAQLCDYYDVCTVTQQQCEDQSEDMATWDPHMICPGGVVGGCRDYRICGGTGILQFNCPPYISPCLNVCSPSGPTPTPGPSGPTATPGPGGPTLTPTPGLGGPTPTSSPSGPTPTPGPGGPTATPIPPPAGAPDCRFLSGPTSVSASSLNIHSYQVVAGDANGNLSRVEIYSSPTTIQSWTKIGDCAASGGSYTCWGSTTWSMAGSYYVSCSAYDFSGLRCQGNPWCEWPPNPPSTLNCAADGWSDCYNDLANIDFLTVNVSDSCSFDYADVSLNGVGDSTVLATSSLNTGGNTINMVSFSVVAPGVNIADISPNPIYGGTTITNITANQIGGPSTYQAIMVLDNGAVCMDTFNVSVAVPPPWSQFKDGNAITDGNITFSVPIGSYLMTSSPGGYPGIPVAGGGVSATPGGISTQNWRVAGSPVAITLPTYDSFRLKLPITPQATANLVNEATLLSGTTQYPSGGGYYYFEYSGGGDLTLSESSDNSIDLGTRKVVIFASGNVNINSKITLTKGLGFLMLIAGGNININPSVGGPQEAIPVSDIAGVFFTNLNFVTGTVGPGADEQLHVRGVVFANSQVSLNRSPAVADIPGEIFEFGPDQSIMIPSIFAKKTIQWREVLP